MYSAGFLEEKSIIFQKDQAICLSIHVDERKS